MTNRLKPPKFQLNINQIAGDRMNLHLYSIQNNQTIFYRMQRISIEFILNVCKFNIYSNYIFFFN